MYLVSSSLSVSRAVALPFHTASVKFMCDVPFSSAHTHHTRMMGNPVTRKENIDEK
jgi:hypothetical protein